MAGRTCRGRAGRRGTRPVPRGGGRSGRRGSRGRRRGGELGGVAEDGGALGGPLFVVEAQVVGDGAEVVAGQLLVREAPFLAGGQGVGGAVGRPSGQMAGVGQVGVDQSAGGVRPVEGGQGLVPYPLVVGLVGAQGDEDGGVGGEAGQQGVQVTQGADGAVRAVGVGQQGLFGFQQGAGAGVLGAAAGVRLGGRGEAAGRVPPGDGAALGRGPAEDGDDGERARQSPDEGGDGERRVVEVGREDDGAPGRGHASPASVEAGRGRGTRRPAKAVSQARSSPCQRPGAAAMVRVRMPGGRAATSAGAVRRSHSRAKV